MKDADLHPSTRDAANSAAQNFDGSPAARLHAAAYDQAPPVKHESYLGRAYDFASGVVDIGKQVVSAAATKAYDEVTEHPLQTLEHVAEGAAIGAAIIAAAPLAGVLGASAGVVAGIGVAADCGMSVLTMQGIGSAINDSLQASKKSAGDTNILMHKSEHTEAEIEAARKDIREKTGDAALKVAGLATLSFGAIGGAAMRAGTKVAGVLQNEISTASRVHAAELLPELSLFSQEAPAMAMAEAPKVEPVAVAERFVAKPENFQLPSTQSIRDFANSIHTFIDERNDFVDLRGLVDAHKKQGGDVLDPHSSLAKTIDREFQIRREGVANLFNAQRKNLFEDQVVPQIKFDVLRHDPYASAAYKKGSIMLKGSDLIDGRTPGTDYLTRSILHEAKHAEQEGLIMRKYIDDATGGDTTGRDLTHTEKGAIANKLRWNFDATAESLIDDVNKQRAGRPLTKVETERAEGLLHSMNELYNADHDSEKLHLSKVSALWEDLHSSDTKTPAVVAARLLEGTNFFDVFRHPSDDLMDFRDTYEIWKDIDSGDGMHDFDPDVVWHVRRGLEDEISQTTAKVVSNHNQYMGWQHEREAFAVGDAGAKASTAPDTNEVLQRLFKMLK